MVSKLEVVDLVVEVVGEGCLKEVKMMDEGYLIKVEVVVENCSMNIRATSVLTIDKASIIKYER